MVKDLRVFKCIERDIETIKSHTSNQFEKNEACECIIGDMLLLKDKIEELEREVRVLEEDLNEDDYIVAEYKRDIDRLTTQRDILVKKIKKLEEKYKWIDNL